MADRNENMNESTSVSDDRLINFLSHLFKLAVVGFAIAFIALGAVALLGSPQSVFAFIVVFCVAAAVFLLGIGCVMLLATREIILWRRQQWRFSLRTLLIVTTLIAVGLGLIVYFTRQ
jgi:hypothetical protein